jgi:ubiquinone/menaquinone biosynthesis C-methylase UbiE
MNMKTILGLLMIAALARGQVAEKANTNYRTKEGRENMARTLGAPERAERLKAAELTRALGIKPGMLVADLGTGVGALLPALSAAAGVNGRVIAQDIFRDFLDKARAKAQAEKLGNVMYVEGAERNPNLPENCCDLVVTVDAYHHFDYPESVLAGIRKALRPGGRFAVVDYYKRFDAMGNGDFALEHIRLDAEDVVKEVEAQGFKLADRREHVPGKQYIATFTVR